MDEYEKFKELKVAAFIDVIVLIDFMLAVTERRSLV